jgi:hypothetical protein
MNQFLVITVLSLFLISCGGSELVREDVGDYDLNKYLIGTGVADTEKNAKARARSDLAKVFEVEVKEDTLDTSQFQSGAKGVNKSWKINRNISTYTNKVLTGVQIASVKKDKKTQQYRAIALLPRDQAATSLKQQLNLVDTDINALLNDADTTNNLLESVRLNYKALVKQKQREQLQKALVVVDTSGEGITSSQSYVQVAQKLSTSIQQLRFSVVLKGQSKLDIVKITHSALANVGVTVTADGDYQLQTSIQVIDLGVQQDWNWFKALVSLQIKDAQRRPLAEKKVEIKVAALDKASAKLKLEKKLLKITEETLLKMLLNR